MLVSIFSYCVFYQAFLRVVGRACSVAHLLHLATCLNVCAWRLWEKAAPEAQLVPSLHMFDAALAHMERAAGGGDKPPSGSGEG